MRHDQARRTRAFGGVTDMNGTGNFLRACTRAGLAAIGLAGLVTSAQAADKAYGEYLASECAGCHRPTGPQVGGVRVIHGMEHAAVVKALKEYRDKTRPNNVMQNVAGKLVDDDIEALAAYYSSLAK
jgi:cytochrome c553